MVSFWQRVADLGHFTELKVKITLDQELEIVQCVPSCPILDLCDFYGNMDWSLHLCDLLEGLKEHKTLRTLKVHLYEHEKEDPFGLNYCLLR
jgi:hypothetical protein